MSRAETSKSSDNFSVSTTNTRNRFSIEQPVKEEKYSTGLQLAFRTKCGTVPSETDLVRQFRRIGALKEGGLDSVTKGNETKINIWFERHIDARKAYTSLRSENLYGPELLSYKLVHVREMERTRHAQNGEDQSKLKNASCTNDASVRSPTVETSINTNPNPNPSIEPNSSSTIQADEILADPNPNRDPNRDPNSSNNIQAGETLIDPNPNPSSSTDTLINLELNPNTDSNLNSIHKWSRTIEDDSSVLYSYWRYAEQLEIFRHIPQTPHFKKLQSEKLWKFKAPGLMVAYADLVESLSEFFFHDDLSVFEEKLELLVEMEENGFIVDPIRTRLTKLIQIKTEGDMDKRAELVRENEMIDEEVKRRQLAVEKLDKESKDIKEGIKEETEACDELMRERDAALKEMEAEEESIETEMEELCRLKKLSEMLQEKFERAKNDD